LIEEKLDGVFSVYVPCFTAGLKTIEQRMRKREAEMNAIEQRISELESNVKYIRAKTWEINDRIESALRGTDGGREGVSQNALFIAFFVIVKKKKHRWLKNWVGAPKLQ